MKCKDATRQEPRRKGWLAFLLAAAGVVGLCILARGYLGPGRAAAQAANSQKPAGRGPVAPASSKTATARNSAASQASLSKADTQAARNTSTAAAIVNGEQITRQALATECVRRYGEEVLESIVNRQLIWQACQQRGVVISEQDVENEVSRMAGKFGLSTERWLSMLEREREIQPNQYRAEIVWPTLALRRLAADRLAVTQEDLRKAFESEYGPKIKARMIAVSNRQKAEQVRQLALARPDNFGELAKQHSEDPNSASARGMIPPIRKHLGNPEFEAVAFSLKENEISQVVQVADQFLVLKCEKLIPETYLAGPQLKQIQEQLQDQIRDQKLRTAAAELFKKLQDESKVVNVFNNPTLREKMPGVAATINGSSITLEFLSGECLKRHGSEVVSGEINRLILQQELKRRGKSVADADIDEEVARAADSYGYLKPDGSPDVNAWLKAVTENDKVSVDLYVRDAVWPSVALKLLVRDKIEVTKEDLDKGFEANYGERVEVLAVVLGSQRQANTVWELARSNPSEQFFGELASQHSVEPVSRSNFGRVPPIPRHGGQPIVEEEAFRLKPGELSGILAVGDKYIILKCLGRTRPVVQDRKAVDGELTKDLREKKLRVAMAGEFDRLKEAAAIDNFIAGSSQPGSLASRTGTEADRGSRVEAATRQQPQGPTRR